MRINESDEDDLAHSLEGEDLRHLTTGYLEKVRKVRSSHYERPPFEVEDHERGVAHERKFAMMVKTLIETEPTHWIKSIRHGSRIQDERMQIDFIIQAVVPSPFGSSGDVIELNIQIKSSLYNIWNFESGEDTVIYPILVNEETGIEQIRAELLNVYIKEARRRLAVRIRVFEGRVIRM